MAVGILQLPEKTITIDSTAYKSKWTAAHNPIILKLQRKDNVLSGVYNNGGRAQVITSLTVPVGYQLRPGDYVYIYGANGNVEKYNQVAKVYSVVNSDNFTLDIPFNGGVTFGGVLNYNQGIWNGTASKYTSYYLSTDVYCNGVYIGNKITHPSPEGVINLNFQSLVSPSVNLENDFDYETQNWLDENNFCSYSWSYQEVIDNATPSRLPYNPSNNHYVICAAKQIQNKYGQNLLDFILLPTLDDNILPKFLEPDDAEPTYFKGYPFDLSYIYSELMSPLALTIVQTQYDINGNGTSEVTDDSLVPKIGVNHFLMVNGDQISCNTKKFGVQITKKTGSVIGLGGGGTIVTIGGIPYATGAIIYNQAGGVVLGKSITDFSGDFLAGGATIIINESGFILTPISGGSPKTYSGNIIVQGAEGGIQATDYDGGTAQVYQDDVYKDNVYQQLH